MAAAACRCRASGGLPSQGMVCSRRAAATPSSVRVGDGVDVGVDVGVETGDGVGMGVDVGVGTGDGVGMGVDVGVGTGDGVGMGVDVGETTVDTREGVELGDGELNVQATSTGTRAKSIGASHLIGFSHLCNAKVIQPLHRVTA